MTANHWLLAQLQRSSDSGIGVAIIAFYLIVLILVIAGIWKVFEKAGQPGWGAIIPIYNVILLLKIANKPLWWIILFFIPLINLIPGILVPVGVSRNFGHGVGFALGLIFLPFIFYPMLGFGSSTYNPVE